MNINNRRAAYRWVAMLIRECPPDPTLTRPEVCAEVERIRAALEAAGALIDDGGTD